MRNCILLFALLLFATFLSAQTTSEIVKVNVKGCVIEMVKVDGGTFCMGCSNEQGKCGGDENPTHLVDISDFYIGKFEVTQELWKAVMSETIEQHRDKINTKRPLYGNDAKCPMYYLSWDDCMSFVEKLNKLTGKNFRLPTEAEWEYAARGGKYSGTYRYAGSNNYDEVCWHSENSGVITHPVGMKKCNELGLYDMSGNVWEWCSDWYDVYDNTHQTNPAGPEKSGLGKVLRGGSWYNKPEYCRVARRMFRNTDNRGSSFGLRLAM